MKKLKRYIWNILISIDQFANVVFMGGDPDETISSNLGKRLRERSHNKIEGAICKVLDKLDPNHCIVSIEEDEGKDEVIK